MPSTNLFFVLCQEKSTTIKKITNALYKIERYDIIFQTRDLIEKFCTCNFEWYNAEDILNEINSLNCSLLLKKDLEFSTRRDNAEAPLLTHAETQLTEVPANARVLLTYSVDAKETAATVAREFQKINISVLLLNEHHYILNEFPEEFILECYAGVDYIFPIVTENYLKIVTSDSFENIDHKYVRYIYRVMNTFHKRKEGVKNNVRCLIPDDQLLKVVSHPLIYDSKNSLFEIWLRISEINVVIEAMLKLNN